MGHGRQDDDELSTIIQRQFQRSSITEITNALELGIIKDISITHMSASVDDGPAEHDGL